MDSISINRIIHSGAAQADLHAGLPDEQGAQEAAPAEPPRGLEGGAGEDPAGPGAAARAEASHLESHEGAGHRGHPGSDQDRGPRAPADGQAAQGPRGRERRQETDRRAEA